MLEFLLEADRAFALFLEERWAYIVLAILVPMVLLTAVDDILPESVHSGRSNRCFRRRVGKRKPVSAEDYLAWWNDVGSRSKRKEPGCYVIMIYDAGFRSGRSMRLGRRYDDIYIGQSVDVYRRVRNHLTGHGNGDVYADVRSGKQIRVRFILCRKKELNDMEKKLIGAYSATDSYNRTKGGARVV